MATIQTVIAPAGGQVQASTTPDKDQQANTQALVPVSPTEKEPPEQSCFSPVVALLPVELDVAVPVRDFRVRNLLALELGQLIESQWGHGEDLPLACADVQLAWTEFEVVESQMSVRITRLA